MRMLRRTRTLSIHALPPELFLSIIECLDHASLRACLLTCRIWYTACSPVLYVSPRLSSAAGMDSFVKALKSKDHLGSAVRHLHIQGNTNYTSFRETHWIRHVPERLVALLPNVRALTFESIESVFFNRNNTIFTDALPLFKRVTELEVKNCKFDDPSDLRSIVFSFPALSTLTLSFVRWRDSRLDTCDSPREWHPILSLQKLRLEFLSGDTAYAEVFRWFEGYTSVRELALTHVPPRAMYVVGQYLTQLASSGGSLKSLTFSPLIMHDADLGYLPSISQALQAQQHLRALHLHVVNLNDNVLRWVPDMFDTVRNLPVAEVSLEFTLDLANADATGSAWIGMNERLSSYWRTTLSSVKLTHHPVGRFIADEDIPRIFKWRFPDLVKRGILDVRIGVRYLEN